MRVPWPFCLQAGWECLWWLPLVPPGGSVQRLDGAGFVEVNHRVELLREAGFEVMADPLGFRVVDDTNGSFQSNLAQRFMQPIVSPHGQQEIAHPDVVEQSLEASD